MPPGPFSVNWFYFKMPFFFFSQSDRKEEEAGGAETSDWKMDPLKEKKQGEMEGSSVGERVKENTAVTKGSARTVGVDH